MIGMTAAVILALGFGLALGWVLFRTVEIRQSVEVDVSVDFLGLFAELQIYREAKAMVAVGTEARVLDKDIGAAQLDALKARLAAQIERALGTLGLDPLSLPYPKYQALEGRPAPTSAGYLPIVNGGTVQASDRIVALAVERADAARAYADLYNSQAPAEEVAAARDALGAADARLEAAKRAVRGG